MDKISIIVPCYNEQDSLPYFYEAIVKISEKMSGQEFEYLFINDGSRDSTLNLIKDYALKDIRVKYISFSRNFGKEAGIYAGLHNVTGDYVLVMDADLQHPPALLLKMYSEIKKGVHFQWIKHTGRICSCPMCKKPRYTKKDRKLLKTQTVK